MLLFEALFNEIVSQIDDADTKNAMGCSRKLGCTELNLSFDVGRFSVPEDDVMTNPDAKSIQTFSAKLSYSYGAGYNEVNYPHLRGGAEVGASAPQHHR